MARCAPSARGVHPPNPSARLPARCQHWCTSARACFQQCQTRCCDPDCTRMMPRPSRRMAGFFMYWNAGSLTHLYDYRMHGGANTISFWLGNDVSHGSGLSGHVRSQSRNTSADQCAFRPNQAPMVACSEHRERTLAVRCRSKVKKMACFCGRFVLDISFGWTYFQPDV